MVMSSSHQADQHDGGAWLREEISVHRASFAALTFRGESMDGLLGAHETYLRPILCLSWQKLCRGYAVGVLESLSLGLLP